jgi:hypothetical protein
MEREPGPWDPGGASDWLCGLHLEPLDWEGGGGSRWGWAGSESPEGQDVEGVRWESGEMKTRWRKKRGLCSSAPGLCTPCFLLLAHSLFFSWLPLILRHLLSAGHLCFLPSVALSCPESASFPREEGTYPSCWLPSSDTTLNSGDVLMNIWWDMSNKCQALMYASGKGNTSALSPRKWIPIIRLLPCNASSITGPGKPTPAAQSSFLTDLEGLGPHRVTCTWPCSVHLVGCFFSICHLELHIVNRTFFRHSSNSEFSCSDLPQDFLDLVLPTCH